MTEYEEGEKELATLYYFLAFATLNDPIFSLLLWQSWDIPEKL